MREYFVIFVVAGAITYFATPFVRAVAVATNAFTPVRERDVHSTPTPRLGGVAIFLGFAAAGLVARELPYLKGRLRAAAQISGVLMRRRDRLPRRRHRRHPRAGLADQARRPDPRGRRDGLQGRPAALAVPFFGTSTVLPTPVLVAVTVIVVLATVNAVNFIDGLDGLAVGVVAIAALAFFIYCYYIVQQLQPAERLLQRDVHQCRGPRLLSGFLPHNFHPARLFMGDSGALLLGLLLAAATISLSGSVDPDRRTGGA